jgi:MFS family permease
MESRAVIRTYLVMAGLYTLSASLIWGVNTLFLLDAGLDIFEVFIANAAFTAGMVVFEIPTGVVADTAGRRTSFLLSIVVLVLGTLLYLALAQTGAGVVAFSAASIVLGLGFTFYSGAVEAWLVDALDATGYTGALDQVFARGGQVTGAAMLIGTVGGGLLGGIDLALPYIARVGLLVAVFLVALRSMRDIGFQSRSVSVRTYPSEMHRVLNAGIQYGLQRHSVRLIMIVSFIQTGFLMWAFYAWPPYFLELLNRDAVWVAGVVAGLISIATIVGNTLVARFAKVCGRRTTMLLGAVVAQGAAAVGVGLVGSFWPALALLLISMGAMGVAAPVKQAYLNQVIPSSERATVLSFDAMTGSAGGVVGQIGLGAVSRARSVAAGYVVGGLISLLALVPLTMLRRMREPADSITAPEGAEPGAFAAHGLPELTEVDSVPRRGD